MITDNNKGAGGVQEYIRVVPDSMRLMGVQSPRTANVLHGIYFEVETMPGKVQVWRQTSKGMELAEDYQASCYLRMREFERTDKLFHVRDGIGYSYDATTGTMRPFAVTPQGTGEGFRQVPSLPEN